MYITNKVLQFLSDHDWEMRDVMVSDDGRLYVYLELENGWDTPYYTIDIKRLYLDKVKGLTYKNKLSAHRAFKGRN